jgi:hypothetical protein
MYHSDRDEDGRIEMPDRIYTSAHAADAALALTEFFEEDDQTLARLANAIQSVCRAQASDLDDRSRYGARVTFVDEDGEAHTAIVLEPEVASMQTDRAWDPYHGEYVNPAEAYPLGTVQLIYTPEFALSDGFHFDRASDLAVATSVQPATSPDQTYCYYSGWSYALEGEQSA